MTSLLVVLQEFVPFVVPSKVKVGVVRVPHTDAHVGATNCLYPRGYVDRLKHRYGGIDFWSEIATPARNDGQRAA